MYIKDSKSTIKAGEEMSSTNIKTDERVIKYLRQKISEANKIVAIIGTEMLVEGGGVDLDSNEHTYRVEEEYGYSPEDMLSCGFFNAKTEKFFKFYKNEILSINVNFTPAYAALQKLQKAGKLSHVICTTLHGLPVDTNFKKVIYLNGNINYNICPRCNKNFDLKYIIKSPGIPQCDKCKTAIRPDVRLIGERVDTKLLTEATNVSSEADVLLIMGTDIYDDHLEFSVTPEKKQTKILFTQKETIKDRLVDFIIMDEIQIILPMLV